MSNSDDMLHRFEQLGTCVTADAFDQLGLVPPAVDNDLRPLAPAHQAVAGWAFTITGELAAGKTSRDSLKLEAIDSLTPGMFAVWAGNGIRGMCCFGDLLAGAMQARGANGALVDGGVRDRQFIVESGFPVFARYTSPAQAIGRWRVTAYQEPVRIKGALEPELEVAPGDLVLADADGVVVVPQVRLSEVLAAGEDALAKEGSARKEILQGMLLRDAIEKYGHL